MLWYEHLLGILAIFTCINGVVVIAAIRVGAMADIYSAKANQKLYKRSAATITRSLSKAADLPILQ